MTGRIYVATRYKPNPTTKDPLLLVTITKYDVTEQAVEFAEAHKKWKARHNGT